MVFRKTDILPWTQEAALLPASMIWGAHAYALADWAGASKSHGLAKIVGELPSGVSLQQKLDSGAIVMSGEAAMFLQMIQDVVSGEAQAAVAPSGSKLDVLANNATMWQVFSELIIDRKKAAMFVYVGTDAPLGAAGGAPGVDIASLFGIVSTKLQGDFDAIEQALNTGFYPVWTAINCGDSRYAPRLEYVVPDPDAAQKSEEQAKKRTRLFDALDRMRALNLEVTQETIDRMALEYGVSDPPKLGARGAAQLRIPDASIPGATLGREARDAQGLPPFGDARDDMTLEEISIYAKGRADAAVAKIKADAQVEVAASPTASGPTQAPVSTVKDAPAKALPGAIKIDLAPTDTAKVVRVREARAAQGLPPFGDYRDDLTLPELEADAKSKADAAAQIKTDAAAAALPTPPAKPPAPSA
jgi:hypothetical protein